MMDTPVVRHPSRSADSIVGKKGRVYVEHALLREPEDLLRNHLSIACNDEDVVFTGVKRGIFRKALQGFGLEDGDVLHLCPYFYIWRRHLHVPSLRGVRLGHEECGKITGAGKRGQYGFRKGAGSEECVANGLFHIIYFFFSPALTSSSVYSSRSYP
jgi:hypothetical protein